MLTWKDTKSQVQAQMLYVTLWKVMIMECSEKEEAGKRK